MSVLKEEDFHSGKCFQPDAQVSSAAVEPPITKAKRKDRTGSDTSRFIPEIQNVPSNVTAPRNTKCTF